MNLNLDSSFTETLTGVTQTHPSGQYWQLPTSTRTVVHFGVLQVSLPTSNTVEVLTLRDGTEPTKTRALVSELRVGDRIKVGGDLPEPSSFVDQSGVTREYSRDSNYYWYTVTGIGGQSSTVLPSSPLVPVYPSLPSDYSCHCFSYAPCGTLFEVAVVSTPVLPLELPNPFQLTQWGEFLP